MTLRQLDLIIDLQYGSTGKGLLAGYLARKNNYDTVCTAWGPNAGHTNIDEHGRKFVHTMLANAITCPTLRRVMIGPGSVLDLDKLHDEIEQCMDILRERKITIYVHPHATVATQADRSEESIKMMAIGSTAKGVGAAMIRKITRQPGDLAVARDFVHHPVFTPMDPEDDPVVLVANPMHWPALFAEAQQILVEGAQGFGLSMSHGFYPYTTSRDVTPMQILADCGVPWSKMDLDRLRIYGTARTYPIRVANRYSEDGTQIGYSGPCYPDQRELKWAELGREPELTTVTKLPRRIFTFSEMQMQFAAAMCGPQVLFLNFVNYLSSREEFEEINEFIVHELKIQRVIYGMGPTILDVHEGLWGSSAKRWADLQAAAARRKQDIQEQVDFDRDVCGVYPEKGSPWPQILSVPGIKDNESGPMTDIHGPI